MLRKFYASANSQPFGSQLFKYVCLRRTFSNRMLGVERQRSGAAQDHAGIEQLEIDLAVVSGTYCETR